MSNKYELIRSKETGCPICIFDNENQVRVCTFNSSNPAIESEAGKVLDGLNETATLHAQLGEARSECERLKAREVTLTDRQCLVQLAFTELGFNYESGEGLPELAKRVAGMASAYRARDNIGMSREEYHKAKNALTQIARLQQREGELVFRLKDLSDAVIIDAEDKRGPDIHLYRRALTARSELAALQSVAKEGEK